MPKAKEPKPAAAKADSEQVAQTISNFHAAVELQYGAYRNIFDCPMALLHSHPRNYQSHPPDQLQEIATSLKNFGQTKPALAWPRRLSEYADETDNDGYFLIGGHGLVEAAKMQGWESLWIRVLPEGMPEDMVLAYIAVDNETARGAQVNMEKLALIVRRTEKTLGATMAQAAAGGKEALEGLQAMAGQSKESLADLLARYGEPNDEDYWPKLRLAIPPDLLGRFNEAMRAAPGDTEAERFAALLDSIDLDQFADDDEAGDENAPEE